MKKSSALVVLTVLVLVFGCKPEPGNQSEPTPEQTVPQSPDLETPITLREVQSGKTEIKSIANAETTARWHKQTIRLAWDKLHPERPPLNDEQLRNIFRDVMVGRGAQLALPENFVQKVAFILNGVPTAALSPVGILLLEKSGNFQPRCTAILSRSDTILTAGHCLDETEEQADWKAYFPFEGIRDVKQNTVRRYCEPGDTHCSAEIDDLATMTLAHPYQFAPVAQEGASSAVLVEAEATILGFGVDDEIVWDNGILREGRVRLQTCHTCDGTVIEDNRRLCFNFYTASIEEPEPTPGIQGNLKGDSGGPMLAGSSLNSVIGVASSNNSCGLLGQKEGRYVNITNSTYDYWLESAICSPACLTTDSTDIFDDQVTIPLEYESASYAFSVGERPKKLIVAMNHETLGFDDPPAPLGDLEIEMPEAFAESANCERHWGVEVCTVDQPEPGNYQLQVKSVRGEPAYQLTVVVIRCPTEECWIEHLSASGELEAPILDEER